MFSNPSANGLNNPPAPSTISGIAGDVLIERDSSGDISVSDVGGRMELVADSSGSVYVADVRGTVSLPPNKRD